MSHFWFGTCVYLLFSVVGLLEADIRLRKGANPSLAAIVWAALRFGLCYPAASLIRWVSARVQRLNR